MLWEKEERLDGGGEEEEELAIDQSDGSRMALDTMSERMNF